MTTERNDPAMSKLLPCPFCGGEARPTAHLDYNWFAPVCTNCGVRGPSVKIARGSSQQTMRELLNKADELWNSRITASLGQWDEKIDKAIGKNRMTFVYKSNTEKVKAGITWDRFTVYGDDKSVIEVRKLIRIGAHSQDAKFSAELAREQNITRHLGHLLRRVIGEHTPPSDCFSTGPLYGDARDNACPACEALRFLETFNEQQKGLENETSRSLEQP